MMREYRPARTVAARPRADAYVDTFADSAVVRDLTVYEPDAQWVDSGLLDAGGAPLMRRDRMGPIGFIHHQDPEA